jgi:hypothetical protein
VIVARQEYTVAPGKVAKALAWLREVESWQCYRLVYPHGSRVWSTSLGRVYKVVIEAEYTSLLERLSCLRRATREPEFRAWRERQKQYCLHVYCHYTNPSRNESIEGFDPSRAWD